MPDTSARATARDPWPWVLVALLVAAVPLLVHQGRDQSFFLDEFFFFDDRSLRAPSTLFAPWYGHWVTLPAIAYRVLLQVFGLRTYLPYQLLAIAGHFAVVVVTWATARRLGTRGWIATAAVVPLVVLGSGRPNILFGFQITLTAALALGLLQMLLAVHSGPWSRRDVVGLVCGLLALMCSGVAVATAVGVGAAVLVHRGWRIAAAHTAPLAGAYLAWWLLAPDGHADPDPALGTDAIRFAADMVKHSLGGVAGSKLVAVAIAGLAVLGTVAVGRGARAHRDRLALLIGLVAVTVTFTVSTGVTRAELHGLQGAMEQRYVHILAALLLPVVAMGIERLAAWHALATVPALAVLAVGVPGNIDALDEDVPANVLAPFVQSDLLAAAEPDRYVHPLVEISVSLIQDAARNPSAWEDVPVTPAEQLWADLFLTISQQPRSDVDSCRTVASTTIRTHRGQVIDFVGHVNLAASRDGMTTTLLPYSDEQGGSLVASSPLEITITAADAGSGVLDC